MTHMLLAISLSLLSLPVITLERTVCFGSCPAYKVTIYDDGKVVYEGQEFVKRKGRVEARISKAELEQLVREFDRLDYLKLDDQYGVGHKCPEDWTDYPSAITSLTRNGKQKTVNHYLGCRGLPILDQLRALEDKIDEVVKTDRWIK
jgi:hypothetical protein